MKFNIPLQITQGDRVIWSEQVTEYNPGTDLLSCFIRGAYALDLTGVPNGNGWDFEIAESTSALLSPGFYQAQFVAFSAGAGRKTLGVVKLEVCPSFENLTELDTRTAEEKELEQLNIAIAKLSDGVAEYYIGDRRVRYQDLGSLYERQKYLRNRIAKIKNRASIGGRNVGVRFEG